MVQNLLIFGSRSKKLPLVAHGFLIFTSKSESEKKMIVEVTASGGSVPVGSYLARFEKAETTEFVDKKTGTTEPKLKWWFVIASGKFAGSRLGTLTGVEIRPTTQAGRFVAGVVGKPIETGQKINLEDCYGKTCLILTEQSDSGFTKIKSVSPPPE